MVLQMPNFKNNPLGYAEFIKQQATKARKFRNEVNKKRAVRELVSNPALDQPVTSSSSNGITSPDRST